MAKWERHHNTKEIYSGSVGGDPYIELIYPLGNIYYNLQFQNYEGLGVFQPLDEFGGAILVDRYHPPYYQATYKARSDITGFVKIDDSNLNFYGEGGRFLDYRLSPAMVYSLPETFDTMRNVMLDALIVIAGFGTYASLPSTFTFEAVSAEIENEIEPLADIQQVISGLSARLVPLYTEAGDRINERIGVYIAYDGPEFDLDNRDSHAKYRVIFSVFEKDFDVVVGSYK